MQTESKQPHTSSLRGRQILERRKEIDPIRKRPASNGAGQELMDMLKETKSDFTLNNVRDAIFHEEDNDDMIYPIGYKVIQRGEVVDMFDPSSRTQGVHYGAGRGGNASELTPLETANS